MRTPSIRRWMPFAVALLLGVTLVPADAFARGGGGRGRGGGSSRADGAAGRAASAAARAARTRRDRKNSEEEKEQRAEERASRVAAARIAYAKRERSQMWDDAARDKLDRMLDRVLD